jgi:hypothetical protein
VRRGILALLVLGLGEARAQSIQGFKYYPPGTVLYGDNQGINDRRIHFPDLAFPLKVGRKSGDNGEDLHAYANSQVYPPDGYEQNDKRLYVYPWSDTLCESKHSLGPMPDCPGLQDGKIGHQGVDIRPSAPTDKKYKVVAMANGRVVKVTPWTRIVIRFASNNGTSCTFLHLEPRAGLRDGTDVKKGDVIGTVSNLAEGIADTTYHLHFECTAKHPDSNKLQKMPVYASLVAAYRRAWGLPDAVTQGFLERDPEREIGASGAPPLPAGNEVKPPVRGGTSPANTGTPQANGELVCPFALPPGEPPKVVDGREIPTKSERSCNFVALTADPPPRYLRVWPGVTTETIFDNKKGKIFVFQTAESGVGAWWYWVTRRASSGPELDQVGFGNLGQPTIREIARAMAGKSATEEYVLENYLTPYLRIGAKYFGVSIKADTTVALNDPVARWKLAQTMFHHESGFPTVVTDKVFGCGVDFGSDVARDFDRAGVEINANSEITYQSFKGLAYYTQTCLGAAFPPRQGEVLLKPINPTPPPISSDVAELRKQLSALVADLSQRIRDLSGGQPDRPAPGKVGGQARTAGDYVRITEKPYKPLW